MDAKLEEWTVYLEERAERGEEGARRVFGTCSSPEEAEQMARYVVDRSLDEFRDSNNADDIFRMWSMFGDDAFIVPPCNFSGLDYARKRSSEERKAPDV